MMHKDQKEGTCSRVGCNRVSCIIISCLKFMVVRWYGTELVQRRTGSNKFPTVTHGDWLHDTLTIAIRTLKLANRNLNYKRYVALDPAKGGIPWRSHAFAVHAKKSK
jgi:hypothetical protein